jgi:hypothetical protein
MAERSINEYTIKFISSSEYSESLVREHLSGLLKINPDFIQISKAGKPLDAVIYPEGGASQIRKVYVSFNRKVSKGAAEAIFSYWASVPYVGKLEGVDWKNRIAMVHVDVSKSKSSDVSKRNILEFLYELLTVGYTPKKGTKKVHGLGQVVTNISGVKYAKQNN